MVEKKPTTNNGMYILYQTHFIANVLKEIMI